MKDFSKNVKNWFLQGRFQRCPNSLHPQWCEVMSLEAWRGICCMLQILLQMRELLLAIFYISLIFYIGNIQTKKIPPSLISPWNYNLALLTSFPNNTGVKGEHEFPSPFGISLAEGCFCQSAGPLYWKLAVRAALKDEAGHQSQSREKDFIVIFFLSYQIHTSFL